MPHYFAPEQRVEGTTQRKSTIQTPAARREFVERARQGVLSLAKLDQVASVELRVCGLPGRSLVPLDHEVDAADPTHIVSETIGHMVREKGTFDYYVLIEDDILLGPQVLPNAIEFDRCSLVNEVLHPNRVEVVNGERFDTDLRLYGDWLTQHRRFMGRTIAVNVNPHAAIFVLRADKFAYCAEHADLGFRGRLHMGGFRGGPMASAFANFLSSVSLYRFVDDLEVHWVEHMDPYDLAQPSRYARLSGALQQLLPPVLTRALRSLKRTVLPM